MTTNKKVKKENKDKKVNKKDIKKKTSFVSYLKEKIIQNNLIETKDKIFEFYQYRMSMVLSKRYNTEKSIDFLLRDLIGCRDQGLIISECIDEAIGRGWLTPKPSYFKNNNFNNKKSISEINQAAGESWLAKRAAARAEGRIE